MAACPGRRCAGLVASACPGGWPGFADCETRILRCQAGVRERVYPKASPVSRPSPHSSDQDSLLCVGPSDTGDFDVPLCLRPPTP